ncbi:MAG: methyltransferase domain-containing protein [Candidatus Acidiferrales bacterium]
MRAERALPGTHKRVVETALRYVRPGVRALDLGAGSGALAERLLAAGYQVTGADISNYFELDTEFLELDFNDPKFDERLPHDFELITSVEVIEHLENPTAFLKSIARLLSPSGIAIVTTPNVENVAARIKFLIGGNVRAMDINAPEHITPIHLDLFLRQVVPKTGLELIENFVYPYGDFPLTGRRYFVPLFRMIAPFLKGPALTGDCHIFVLRRGKQI